MSQIYESKKTAVELEDEIINNIYNYDDHPVFSIASQYIGLEAFTPILILTRGLRIPLNKFKDIINYEINNSTMEIKFNK